MNLPEGHVLRQGQVQAEPSASGICLEGMCSVKVKYKPSRVPQCCPVSVPMSSLTLPQHAQ
eukprot:2350307-Pleurochrysis_carterae.AAC.3